MGFFCLCGVLVFSQDQKKSDSLKKVLKISSSKDPEHLETLQQIAEHETNADELLLYSQELIESATKSKATSYIYDGYLQKGNAYRLKSDLPKALEAYFQAAEIAATNDFSQQQATIKISIADVYSIMGDSKLAVKYYRESIDLLESLSTLPDETIMLNLASAQLNLGDEYYLQTELDSALYYFDKSEKQFEILEDELGIAYNLGNIGLVFAEKGDNEQAEKNLNRAIDVLTQLEDYYPICVYLLAMSDVYKDRDLDDKALEYATRSLELAQIYGLKEQIADSFLKLSQIYEDDGDLTRSFNLYKEHIIYRDSVNSLNAIQDMATTRTEFYVSQKQTEVDLLNVEKKNQQIIVIGIGIALALIGLLALSLFKRNKFMKKTNKIIEYEKQRSDDLLQNILPEETAKELKENGTVQAKRFEAVSVLFTDFKGFTSYSENLTPEELVKTIDFYFSKFDAIMEKHGLEKIKTVGDAYMCAAGLPFEDELHYYKITLAALDIVDFVNETMNGSEIDGGFDIRIGINSGSVVAGVVGTKKFAYDIWGDTVNVASRMESSGQIGRVNISETTYKLLKKHPEFSFESRGAIEAKGKGKIEMFFVNKNKTQQSILQ